MFVQFINILQTNPAKIKSASTEWSAIIKNVNYKNIVSWQYDMQFILVIYTRSKISAYKIGALWTLIPDGTL